MAKLNIAKVLQKLADIVPEKRLLEFYPPFLFIGVKVMAVSDDYRSIHVRVPLRWYGTNMHGSMFGGFVSAVSDPLNALVCERLFPGTEVWTKCNCVEFKRPARSYVDYKFEISEADVLAIDEGLEKDGQVTRKFSYDVKDKRGHVVAHITNEIFLRLRDRKGPKPKEPGDPAPV